MIPTQRVFLQTTVNGVIAMFFEAGYEYTKFAAPDDGRLHGVRLHPSGWSYLASAAEEELRPFDAWEWSRLVDAHGKKVEAERKEELRARRRVEERIERLEANVDEMRRNLRQLKELK
jgi:hypothetical protein